MGLDRIFELSTIDLRGTPLAKMALGQVFGTRILINIPMYSALSGAKLAREFPKNHTSLAGAGHTLPVQSMI